MWISPQPLQISWVTPLTLLIHSIKESHIPFIKNIPAQSFMNHEHLDVTAGVRQRHLSVELEKLSTMNNQLKEALGKKSARLGFPMTLGKSIISLSPHSPLLLNENSDTYLSG